MEQKFFKKLHPLGLGGPIPKTLEQLGVKVELAGEKDLEDYKNIRIEVIKTDPEAFNLTDKKNFDRQINRDISKLKEDIEKQIVVLSKVSHKAIGMIKGTEREGGVWSMGSVYVNPDFRKSVSGGAVAEEMVRKVLDEIRKRGGVQARLWVRASNENAINLYKKLGFRKFNPIFSPKRALNLTGNMPNLLLDRQIMELDLIKKE